MRHTFQTWSAAGVIAIAGLAGCERKSEKPPEAPAMQGGEHCPLCVSDFTEAAAPAAETAPVSTFAIVVPDNAPVHLDGLVDHRGRTLDAAYLNDHFAGRRIVLYFGFPDCEWFCPPSTNAIMTSLAQLKDAGIVPVFIASRTDPYTKQAYTPQRMNEWLQSFGGDQVGGIALTGSPELLGQIYRQMNAVDAKSGNHLPLMGMVDQHGKFLGGVPTVTMVQENGKNVLYPAPQILIPAMQQSFELQVPVSPPAPRGP